MTGERVEQLESRVRELEATLSGLTDELVDTKDRLETIERASAAENSAGRRSDIVEGDLLGENDRDATDECKPVDGDGDSNDGETAGARGSDTATDAGPEETSSDGTERENADSDSDGIIVA